MLGSFFKGKIYKKVETGRMEDFFFVLVVGWVECGKGRQ